MRLPSRYWLIAVLVVAGFGVLPTARSAWDSANKPTSEDLQVLRVVPEGDQVPPGRQIVVTFDRPVVPIGDMFLDPAKTPIVIEPAHDCHWHWLDPRSVACELDVKDALIPATEYRVTVTAGLKAEDGSELKKTYQTTFTTERPAVRQYWFWTWRSPGTPVVRLVFNQPVTQNTVEAHLHFSGQAGVHAEPVPGWREVYYVLPLPGEKEVMIFPGGTPQKKSDDRPATMQGERGNQIEARRSWLVSPLTELRADEHAELRVSPGLRGNAGTLLGIERRTVVEFDTFPEFRFLGVSCRVGTTTALIEVNAPKASQGRCDPLTRVSLAFSSPVIANEIRHHLNLKPDLAGGRTDYNPWANVYPSSQLNAPHKRGQNYEVQLPEHLKAFQDYNIDGLADVADEFGRKLSGPTSMEFATGHRSPRLRLSHPVAVLEKDAPTAMPLYVTNLTDVEYQYRRLMPQNSASGLTAKQDIVRAWDISYAVPAEIRKLLDGRSGVVSGNVTPHPTPTTADRGNYFDDEIAVSPSILPGSGEHDFFAEVTPFQVHVKLGHYNTLVWVTTLSKGTPVDHARVMIYEDSYESLTDKTNVLGEATTDQQGIAMLPGRVSLDPTATKFGYGGRGTGQLMVRVDNAGEMALLPLDQNFLIDTYRASRGRFSSSPMRRDGHVRAWGTTAQGVYKLGDTIQYKFYVRNQNNLTLEPVAARSGYHLAIVDPTGKVVSEINDLELSEFGAYAGEFRVPASGAVGWYEFRLSSPSQDRGGAGAAANTSGHRVRAATYGRAGSLVPMRVLVADFTPAPFQVRTTVSGALFEPGDTVDVATQATLHAGGPYADAGTRVTARVWPEPIDVASPVASGFFFASSIGGDYCKADREPSAATIHESEDRVNERGELATQFTVPDTGIINGRMQIESAVRDERGKYVASRAPAQYRGRDRFVGLRTGRWTFEEGKPAVVQFLVVDKYGKVTPGVPVSVAIRGEVITAARVKGAGNAYLTSYDRNWEDSASCDAKSGDGPVSCTFTPGSPGLYSILATIQDTQNKTHSTELCTWVTGKGRVMWEEPQDMSLSIVPEKDSYKIGEHARYLVRNPFPGAQALITIERFGVIKSWVQTLEGNTPVIEFPVKPDYLPGYYLSVVVMSPRVASVPGASPVDNDGVDLGRPTYRIGYVQARVTDPYKTLDVSIGSDRTSYKPRETVKLQLNARPHVPGQVPEPVEYAVAVLDEAVFDLILSGKDYFDPYRGFYQLDNLDLVNYGLLSRLVGLQKFEKKGANTGGDGGAGFDLRSVSKYIAYWNPSVRADKQGRASLSFTLPDNLTGWRVFAMAVTSGDRLGLGDYKFKSSKLTELRPVMPNQLTEEDKFTAGFSVLNRSNVSRTVTVNIAASGAINGGKQTFQKSLQLGPFKRDTVWMPLTTLGDGTIKLNAESYDKLDRDALIHVLPVHKRVSMDVAASYGTTTQSTVTEPVLFPKNMIPGVGAISLVVSPTVIGNIDGALRYVRDYPYGCWEQRLTGALMAVSYAQLKGYLPTDLKWTEAPVLPQSVLDETAAYQAPNGGMTFWVGQNDRVSPYLSAATALAFNELRKAGYRVPEIVETKLHAYLDRLLRERTAPSFYSEGMVSSVRAVALLAMAEQQRASLQDLERYRDYLPRMDLFGLSAYLRAALKVKGGDDLAAATAQRILSHSNESGGKFQFTEPWDDGYSQILATPLRTQCAVLRAFLAYGETETGAKLVADVPFKLLRSITAARGNRDHWENTQENLYCVNALAEYSRLYEKQSPAFTVRAMLGGESLGVAKFSDFRDTPASLTRSNRTIDVGRKVNLEIEREGQGRLYYATRLSYAPTELTAQQTNAGIEIHREYSVKRDSTWQLLENPVQIKRGEVVRVDLYVSVPAARHFVVVDDPVPGGLEPVNRDLATASTVDADAAEFEAAGGSYWFKYSDWSEYGVSLWNFYHRELKHDSVRFYADFLPAGNYHLSYAAQAITAGKFSASPALAQEMYEPDVYGKGMPAQLIIRHE